MFSDASGKCYKAAESIADYSKQPCNADHDCRFSDGSHSECSCGYNLNGSKYCTAALGDPIYVLAKSILQDDILKNNQQCHTEMRLNAKCKYIREKNIEFKELLLYGKY